MENKKITKSNEDYLEAILCFEKETGTKSIDVANSLGVSKAAVNIAVADLIAKGLAKKESYHGIILTDEGREIAHKVYSTHNMLHKFYQCAGISKETAEKECCQIEHILGEETLSKLREFLIGKEL